MLGIKVIGIAIFGLCVQNAICHKYDFEVKYLENLGNYNYYDDANGKGDFIQSLSSINLKDDSAKVSSSGLSSTLDAKSSSSASATSAASAASSSSSTSSSSSSTSSTSSAKSASVVSSKNTDSLSTVNDKLSTADTNEINAEIIKQHNGQPIILYANAKQSDQSGYYGGYGNYNGHGDHHDCSEKIEHGKHKIEGKGETIVHRPSPIIVRRPPTKVLINHAPLIVKQAPVVFHTPGKLVEHKIIHKHLPRPVHVRPVMIKVIKPIEKKIIIDRPVKSKVLVEKQPERKYYIAAKGCEHQHTDNKISNTAVNDNNDNYNYNYNDYNNDNYDDAGQYESGKYNNEEQNNNNYNEGYEYENGNYEQIVSNKNNDNVNTYYQGSSGDGGSTGTVSSDAGNAYEYNGSGLSYGYDGLTDAEKQYIIKSDTAYYNLGSKYVEQHGKNSYSSDADFTNANSEVLTEKKK